MSRPGVRNRGYGYGIDSRAFQQLEVLRQLDLILSGLRVRFWLRGGWGVDFLLGRVTRSHADLDLVTWQRHRRRIYQALHEAESLLERELPVQSDFIKDGQDVTIVYLERVPDGSVVAHGTPEWVWQPDALPSHRHCLQSICARVVSPRQMLRDLKGYEAATGRPLRPKDAGTMTALRDIIEGTRN